MTRADLDKAAETGCNIPGCVHVHHDQTFYLHGACHPFSALEARYTKGTGLLRVSCVKCHKLIAWIAVADINPLSTNGVEA